MSRSVRAHVLSVIAVAPGLLHVAPSTLLGSIGLILQDLIMKAFLASWGATAFVFLVIDAIWLGLVATSFYARALGDLMLDQPKLGIAALFYVGYTFAVVLLVAAPAAKAGSLSQALLYGAVFGLAAYGTYDITNMATLKNWPMVMSLIDMVWGTLLTATAAAAGYVAYRYVS